MKKIRSWVMKAYNTVIDTLQRKMTRGLFRPMVQRIGPMVGKA